MPRREMPPRPPWHGAPHGVIPGIVSITRVLAQSEQGAIGVTHLAVYPRYFSVSLLVFRIDGDWVRGLSRTSGLGLRSWVLGVVFSDGSEAGSAQEEVAARAWAAQEQAGQPMMHGGPGRGGEDWWQEAYWIWPLPPLGSVTLTCEWREVGIEPARWDLDSQLILDAAGRSRVIWSETPSAADET